ncbi:MAG: FAD-dependent oxidoreductase [Pseudomonadota bacterium]
MQNIDVNALTAALPIHLAERCDVIGTEPPNPDGDWVVYWMHHAMRGHDNPALEVAITFANSLRKPLMVYQGLGGQHAYDSDRSHWFILQGAHDVARELNEAGIDYRFWLPRDHARSPLPTIVSRAAALVMEQMPVAPFPRWQAKLVSRATTTVVRVDARCIVPMTLLNQAPDRAFRYRDKTKHEYRQRIAAGWPATALEVHTDTTQVHDVFESLPIATLSDSDLHTLIASQPIDHTIGPVIDTPGGSTAGYQRWQTFLDQGLASYHKKRNDAALRWPQGVSRLSPYLHYGMVSPFRIAKQTESANLGGSGKFLEELTIWRELAHHFCAHCDDPDSLAALPSWAQKTLREHAEDHREHTYPLTALQRGSTHSELWNLAQRSLLVHGELHNNLRMTWAKAIGEWRASPSEALAALLDLNHRYALDGNDPSSYGGLLWALGLFDRPFDPPQPVLGTVRPRSVDAHAKRMDVPQYRQHIGRTQGQRRRIAVIGAGISGLTVARALHDHNHDVSVFEKSRGPGGRTATRRRDPYQFDHGAQYFTATDPRFVRQTRLWHEAKVIRPWDGAIVSLQDSRSVSEKARWHGTGGMNQICRHLAESLDIKRQCRITQIRRQDDQWIIDSEHGELPDRDRVFDTLIITAPAPQTHQLLSEVHPEFAELAASIDYDPCWAMMTVVDATDLPAWRGAFGSGQPVDWISLRSAAEDSATCVAHASPAWSQQHLESDAESVADMLADAVQMETGLPIDRAATVAHRWRYARVRNPALIEAAFDPLTRLGIAGDWLGGNARIESAWLSGAALCGHVLRAQSISS